MGKRIYVRSGGAWVDFSTPLGTNSFVTEVVAGNGLSGGSVGGSATLDIGQGTGITVNSNSIEVDTSVIATKTYVDSVAEGLDVKASVRVATTADLASLSTLLTIDGIALNEDDRVLVKNQTNAVNNGIYLAKSGSWERAADAAQNGELTPGTFVFVEVGSTNADSGWVMTSDGTITIGSTAMNWSQFSGAGQITAGTGLTKSGNTLSVQLTDSISSTSTTTAATPNSVKTAYDLANSANTVYYQTTQPTGGTYAAGDIWIDSDDNTTPNSNNLTIAQKVASYTLATDLSDAPDEVIEMNVATANTVSIPTDATANYPIGTQIHVFQLGTGQTTIQAVTSGTTTVVGTPGLKLRAQYSFATLIKRAANYWIVVGDTAA